MKKHISIYILFAVLLSSQANAQAFQENYSYDRTVFKLSTFTPAFSIEKPISLQSSFVIKLDSRYRIDWSNDHTPSWLIRSNTAFEYRFYFTQSPVVKRKAPVYYPSGSYIGTYMDIGKHFNNQLYARIGPVVGVQILPNNRLYFNASIGPGLLIFQDYSLWIAALAQMKAGIILNKPPG